MKTKLKRAIIDLNIFKHAGSDEHQIYCQKIGTRADILILVAACAILSFSTFFAIQHQPLMLL